MVKGVKPLARHKHPAGAAHMRARAAVRNGNRSILLQYFALAVLVLAGVVLGASLSKNAATQTDASLTVFLQDMLSKNVASKGFWYLFASSFFSSSLLLCAAFVLGLCAAGSPGHIGVAVFKGAGIGLTMGCVYVRYGAKGLGICMLFLLPWAILTTFSILIACREGIRFSILVLRVFLPSCAGARLWNAFCDYCTKFVACFVLVFIAAVIQSLSSMAFSALFFS